MSKLFDPDDHQYRLFSDASTDPHRKKPAIHVYVFYGLCGKIPLPPEIRPIRIHCISRVSVQDLFAAFQCGADAVFVAGRDADCKYKNIVQRVMQRIEHVKHLLDETGIDIKRLEWFDVSANAEESWAKAAEEMLTRVSILK